MVVHVSRSDIISKGAQADWLVVSVHLKNGSRRVNYRMAISIILFFTIIHEQEAVLKLLVCSLT